MITRWKDKVMDSISKKVSAFFENAPYPLMIVMVWIVFGAFYACSWFTGKDPIKGQQMWNHKFVGSDTYKKKKGLFHIFDRWELQDYSRWT